MSGQDNPEYLALGVAGIHNLGYTRDMNPADRILDRLTNAIIDHPWAVVGGFALTVLATLAIVVTFALIMGGGI
jgi:hypothetical protein